MELNKINKRDASYELVRVISMIFIIVVHCIVKTNSPIDNELSDLLKLIFFTGNGMFLILSGMFALNTNFDNKESYYLYYKKKIINLIIPIIFYMFIKNCCTENFNILNLKFWKSFITNLLGGYANTEYWFLYILIGNILIVPLLQPAFKNLSSKGMYCYCIVGLIINACSTYLPYFGLEFKWGYMFAGWTYYFYLGYIINKLNLSEKFKDTTIIIGCICMMITLIQERLGYSRYLYDLAPTYTIITIGMFFTIRKINIKSEILNNIIRYIGKYSFSIYMLHKMNLNIINNFLIIIGPYVSKLMFKTIVVFIMSFIMAYIIDNTILRLIKKISNIPFEIYEKRKANT